MERPSVNSSANSNSDPPEIPRAIILIFTSISLKLPCQMVYGGIAFNTGRIAIIISSTASVFIRANKGQYLTGRDLFRRRRYQTIEHMINTAKLLGFFDSHQISNGFHNTDYLMIARWITTDTTLFIISICITSFYKFSIHKRGIDNVWLKIHYSLLAFVG